MTGNYPAAGFAHVRAALDPALVATWRPLIVAAASRLPNRAKTDEVAVTFEPDKADPDVAAILRSPQLGRIAADMLESAVIRLIAAAGYVKPPGAPGYRKGEAIDGPGCPAIRLG